MQWTKRDGNAMEMQWKSTQWKLAYKCNGKRINTFSTPADALVMQAVGEVEPRSLGLLQGFVGYVLRT